MINGDAVRDFIETHRTTIIVILAAVLIVLISILIFVVSTDSANNKKQKEIDARRHLLSFKLEELFLPLEPLQVPDVILSRPLGQIWKKEDVQRWYQIPNSNDRNTLRSLSQAQINEILESIP